MMGLTIAPLDIKVDDVVAVHEAQALDDVDCNGFAPALTAVHEQQNLWAEVHSDFCFQTGQAAQGL